MQDGLNWNGWIVVLEQLGVFHFCVSSSRPTQVSSHSSRKTPVSKKKKKERLHHPSVISLGTDETLRKMQLLNSDRARLKFSFYSLFAE